MDYRRCWESSSVGVHLFPAATAGIVTMAPLGEFDLEGGSAIYTFARSTGDML
ncbi:MAG: hypothetical protein OIF55_16315 [Amphritea sp.]|nr:hypothetical protein [Amphritea sp.]